MEKIRIQKLLSDAGYCSRRKAEAWMAAGKVKVNGHPVKPGDKATYADHITVNGEQVYLPRRKVKRYLMLYKPRGYVTTTSDELDRRCVMDLLEDVEERVYPVGRLDKDSEGLLLLTNDGDLIDSLMRGANRHEKEYVVKVKSEITDEFLQEMSRGVYLSELDKTTRPCQVERLGKFTFRIILTQGLNRQIRRMCQALGYEVHSLKRVRVANVTLGGLKPGEYRILKGKELEELYEIAAGHKRDS